MKFATETDPKSMRDMWDDRWKNPTTAPPRWKYEEQFKTHVQNYEWLRSQLGESTISTFRHVFVPLCGDSPMVSYLAQKGHVVTCVEYVDNAVKQLMASMPDKTFRSGPLSFNLPSYNSTDGTLTLLQGDIFKCNFVSPKFDFIYDRAALAAIPPERQLEYARLMVSSLRENGYYFLDCFETNDASRGPPWNLPPRVVRSYLVEALGLREVHHRNVDNVNPPDVNWFVHQFIFQKLPTASTTRVGVSPT